MNDALVRENADVRLREPLPPGPLHPDLYDCLQVNLASLAEHEAQAAPMALGSLLTFTPRTTRAGLPTVAPLLDEHLDAASRSLGLAVADRRRLKGLDDAPDEDVLAGFGTVYIVADAYHLPWVPYFGHQHMDHSFLARRHPGGGVLVSDAYHNDTSYGRARPSTWELSAADFTAALPDGAELLTFSATPTGAPRRAYRPPVPESAERYVGAFREHPDRVEALEQLTLETWLLSRSRRLHAAYGSATGALGEAPAGLDEHLASWADLTEQVYLAYRRVQRGRPEPGGHLDRLATLLHTDARVFGQRAPEGSEATAPECAPALEALVAEETANILRVPATDVTSAAALDQVPAFSSFRMVEIVERLEDRLGIEFGPDDLVPENLHDIDSLCRIIRRARGEC